MARRSTPGNDLGPSVAEMLGRLHGGTIRLPGDRRELAIKVSPPFAVAGP